MAAMYCYFIFELYNINYQDLFTRSVKNFVRRAHFCLFKQNFERKNFQHMVNRRKNFAKKICFWSLIYRKFNLSWRRAL